MIPYYEELDKGIFLPVVDRNHIDHNIDKKTIQKDFFEKYYELFVLINSLIIKINNISLGDLKNIDINCFNKLNKNISLISEFKKTFVTDYSILEFEKYLLLWGENLDLLYTSGLYKIDFNDYIKSMRLFNDALKEILRLKNTLFDINLPNTYFITSRDYLYNTRSTKHSSGNISGYYDEFNKKFFDGEFEKYLLKEDKTEDKTDKINLMEKMLCKDIWIHELLLDAYLHYKDYILFNRKSFDINYINIIQGMDAIRKDYFNFLLRLYKYTKDPISELNKIIELTKNDYSDVLIRCCGASKVTNSPKRSIVTSRLNYISDFRKYLDNNWNIVFVPPIIIDYEKGCITEYPDEFVKINEFRRKM